MLSRTQRGQMMAFVAVFLAIVVVPLMILAVDVVRAFDVRSRLQTATDAACQAAVQATNSAVYQKSGATVLAPGAAVAQAYREFDGTVRDAGLLGYSPRVAVFIIGPTRAQCNAVAVLKTYIPGAPTFRVHAVAVSDARSEKRP